MNSSSSENSYSSNYSDYSYDSYSNDLEMDGYSDWDYPYDEDEFSDYGDYYDHHYFGHSHYLNQLEFFDENGIPYDDIYDENEYFSDEDESYYDNLAFDYGDEDEYYDDFDDDYYDEMSEDYDYDRFHHYHPYEHHQRQHGHFSPHAPRYHHPMQMADEMENL